MRNNLSVTIRNAQRSWAQAIGLAHDAQGYVRSPEENLPWLSLSIREEFDAADGRELGKNGTRAKIAALHSSSALAVNVFAYWRSRPRKVLAQCLDLPEGDFQVFFERKYRTGVGRRSPNLDVVLDFGSSIMAVESKFCETFAAKASSLRPAYFERDFWRRAGLPGVQLAAEEVRDGRTYRYVDAPQLLKHMLGLGQQSAHWTLLLLWYALNSEVARDMSQDAEEFRTALGVDATRFQFLTYQELWERLAPRAADDHREYVYYVGERYFTHSARSKKAGGTLARST